MRRRLFVLIGVFLLGAASARAQERPARVTAREILAPAVRDRLTDDSLRTFRTRPLPDGRLDVDDGVRRAAYRVQAEVPRGLAPEAAARSYLSAEADAYGLGASTDDLALVSARRETYRSEVVFEQRFAGLPVHDARLKVNLDAGGQPTLVLSAYRPHLARVRGFDPAPRLGAAEAVARLEAAVVEGGVRTSEPELVVYPSKPPRLAWRFTAWSNVVPAEWQAFVDAHTGEVFRIVDQTIHAKKSYAPASPPAFSPVEAPAPAPPAMRRVDGVGFVFDPDPLTTAGVSYGAPYVDADDADVPELNAQLREVVLPEITQGNDGLYRLIGPYVQVDGFVPPVGGGRAYTPPAETSPDGFRYGRSNDFFEAVMVYYHIDKSQRHVQSLDLGREVQQRPIRVNPLGLTQDDSQYSLLSDVLWFGEGGVDDAEDADVIWHEYSHALIQDSAPGLFSGEGQALHEGFSDYWAASYSRFLSEEDPTVPEGNWRKVYTWDGNAGCWQGRPVDHPGHYPDAVGYDYPHCPGQAAFYDTGLLWATTLMEVYDVLGRTVTDRLGLGSIGYLSAPVTLRDAAEAMLQADRDYYGGAHHDVLFNILGTRGFLDVSQFKPVVVHAPLASTEQLGGTVAVELDAYAAVGAIDSVVVYFRPEGGAPFERLSLAPQGEARYAGALPLPGTSGTMEYYIVAWSDAGVSTRMPDDGPEAVYRFGFGPDQEPPSIAHDPLDDASVSGWPVPVFAAVEDNLGVDTVWVDYRIDGPGGGLLAEGVFGLAPAAGGFQGTFPVAPGLEAGSRVHYRIHARDVALAANEAVLPETGTFTFDLVESSVVRAYDFESLDAGFTATGAWERGAPVYGLQRAHSGTAVWGTDLDGAYAATSGRASLTLPPLDLSALPEAYLIFWHWHDLEHDGRAVPDRRTSAFLWDGANVKVSTNAGVTWAVAEPEGGYNGVVASGYGNPLGGETAFGGYSYGWRRVVVPLPAAPDVRVRFELGTDESNQEEAEFFAGWYLDDVSVRTVRPADVQAPTALALPEPEREEPAGVQAIPVSVRADDDTGLAAVRVVYTLSGAVAEQDTLRLAQRPGDLQAFEGILRPERTPAVGDVLSYRVHLVDFEGNEAVYPPEGEAPFTVRYLRTAQANVLAQAAASGQWERFGAVWHLDGTTPAEERSALVLEPVDLPANATSLGFVLRHRYVFGDGVGGNVKLSDDDGDTWTVLTPEGGYGAEIAGAAAHPMAGEPVFGGTTDGLAAEARFDLSAYAGRQIRLRIDFGATRETTSSEYWTVQEAAGSFLTAAGAFETPRTLRLLPNFPDPFSGTTNVSYTLPDQLAVTLDVYDLLGRRVATLVDETQAAGTYTLTFDGGGLANGLYLLRLRAGETQRVERLMVAR